MGRCVGVARCEWRHAVHARRAARRRTAIFVFRSCRSLQRTAYSARVRAVLLLGAMSFVPTAHSAGATRRGVCGVGRGLFPFRVSRVFAVCVAWFALCVFVCVVFYVTFRRSTLRVVLVRFCDVRRLFVVRLFTVHHCSRLLSWPAERRRGGARRRSGRCQTSCAGDAESR